MTARVHSPSRRLPCGCRTNPGPVVPGDQIHRRCHHRIWWTGTVRASAIVAHVAVIAWTADEAVMS